MSGLAVLLVYIIVFVVMLDDGCLRVSVRVDVRGEKGVGVGQSVGRFVKVFEVVQRVRGLYFVALIVVFAE